MVIVTAPDGTSKLFDTADEAVAWANNPEAVEAHRQEQAALTARIRQQELQRAAANRAASGGGWSIRYRRATDDWEVSRGGQREVFETQEEAIAFTRQ